MRKVAPVCLADFEAIAAESLEPGPAAYLFGGSADERSITANRNAYDGFFLLPRVLAALHEASTSVTLFDDTYTVPVFIAPMGFQKLFHPAGEIGLAQAAAAMGAGFVLSTQASTSIEAVAKAGEGAPQWFQLYIQPEREATLRLIRRAEEAGYRALVVTVDAPISGIRNREMRAGFVLPPHVGAVNLESKTTARHELSEAFLGGLVQQAPCWTDLEWVRKETKLPLLIKGVLHPADARRAVEIGCDGIIVSNHGGRVLDAALPPLAALPMIRKVVGDDLPILVDGGIRRGTDVFMAIALGANAVLVGRPMAAALSLAGAQGAAQALRILIDEFAVAMALCGCANPSEITDDWLCPASRPSERKTEHKASQVLGEGPDV